MGVVQVDSAGTKSTDTLTRFFAPDDDLYLPSRGLLAAAESLSCVSNPNRRSVPGNGSSSGFRPA